ncbi:hypothetical protein PHMEG_00021127 [Phytophthora megakarya]|uniref:Bzip transcription factor n=1 Tax=Phytophthora megakarya TaxID=4795 RepID=A0A225VPC4_9STRA|nr:hypothetical protein PHMEG_00021127 [Phytophthora megakarya]
MQFPRRTNTSPNLLLSTDTLPTSSIQGEESYTDEITKINSCTTPAAQLGGEIFLSESPTNPSTKRIRLVRGPGGHTTELTVDSSVENLLELAKNLERKQRRERQRRYRKKQNDQLHMLEKTTAELSKEIGVLESRRKIISASLKTYNVWNLAMEYFRRFRNGLKKTEVVSLIDFVHKTMTVDVATNSGYGATAVLKCWGYLHWFEDVEVNLESMRKCTNGVISTTVASMTISERTLHNVFPTLLNGENEDLAGKLLGKRVTVTGVTYFEWDYTCDKASSIQTRNDVLTPMLGLLGSIENVSRVFDKALISLDFQWRQSFGEMSDD